MTSEYGFYIIISVVLPILVGLVTKRDSLGKYKAYLLLALASANSLVLQLQENWGNPDLNSENILNFVIGAIVSFVIAAATHSGLLKPAHITGSEGKVNNLAPDKGIG